MPDRRAILRLEGEGGMRVIADVDRCCSSGMCVERAPEVFSQREDNGVVVVKIDGAVDAHRAAVLDAAAGCPVNAIHVVEP